MLRSTGMRGWFKIALAAGLLIGAPGCAGFSTQGAAQSLSWRSSPPESPPEVEAVETEDFETLEVTATAYNSLHGQGSGDPTLAAWGDRLKPGMKAIAVSRDLLGLGLTHGAVIEIEGVPGQWTVRDKMNRRWKRRIDLYMGVDRKAALKWGRRPVVIRWKPIEP